MAIYFPSTSLRKLTCESHAHFARKFRRSCHRRTWRHRVSLGKTRCARDVREKAVRQKVTQNRSRNLSQNMLNRTQRGGLRRTRCTKIVKKSTRDQPKSLQNQLFRSSWVDWGRFALVCHPPGVDIAFRLVKHGVPESPSLRARSRWFARRLKALSLIRG